MDGEGAVGGIEQVVALVEHQPPGRPVGVAVAGRGQRQHQRMVGDHQVGMAGTPRRVLDETFAPVATRRMDAFAAPVGERGGAVAPGQFAQPAGKVAAHHVAVAGVRDPARDQPVADPGAADSRQRAIAEARGGVLEIEQAEIVLAPLAPPPPCAAFPPRRDRAGRARGRSGAGGSCCRWKATPCPRSCRPTRWRGRCSRGSCRPRCRPPRAPPGGRPRGRAGRTRTPPPRRSRPAAGAAPRRRRAGRRAACAPPPARPGNGRAAAAAGGPSIPAAGPGNRRARPPPRRRAPAPPPRPTSSRGRPSAAPWRRPARHPGSRGARARRAGRARSRAVRRPVRRACAAPPARRRRRGRAESARRTAPGARTRTVPARRRRRTARNRAGAPRRACGTPAAAAWAGMRARGRARAPPRPSGPGFPLRRRRRARRPRGGRRPAPGRAPAGRRGGRAFARSCRQYRRPV